MELGHLQQAPWHGCEGAAIALGDSNLLCRVPKGGLIANTSADAVFLQTLARMPSTLSPHARHPYL